MNWETGSWTMDRIAEALNELPSAIVTDDQEIVATYTTDFRRLFTGRSRALLRPRTTEEVQQIVKVCRRNGVPLVPQGGNTSYCTAATPGSDNDELVVSLERMNGIHELDAANLSMTADAGAILSDLQDRANEAGLLLPLSLGSEQSCRIGGNLSTNAGGISVLRYGMARDLVLGLEVVLPDASVLHALSPLRKNNSGYDVKQLFIGAEGTLGIITAVSLKLARKAQQTVTALLAVAEISSLSALFDQAQIYTGEAIASFEYISRASLDLLLEAKPQLRHPFSQLSAHYVLVETATASPVLNLEETTTALLGRLFEMGLVIDGSIAASGKQRDDFWQLRENIPEAEVHHGGSVKHDVSVRVSRLPDLIERASAIIASNAKNARLSIYGHVGDGNVHFNVLPPKGVDAGEYKTWIEREISPRIYDLVADMGGSFSAEYGIGRTKLALLERYGDPTKLRLIKELKRAIDPAGLMNPGKVVPR
jgi:FAD/FMN-containing dehydrogenase